MAEIVDPSIPRVIPTDDGVNAIGTAANPLRVTFASVPSFEAVNQALSIADATIDVNGESIASADDVGCATVTATGAVAGASLSASGDVAAAGGFRQSIGPFFVTTAADQTAVGMKFGDTVGQAWVATRAGSVMGVSGMIDGAVTGAGKSIKVRVYKALAADPTSFSLLNAALDLDFTQAGGELADRATAAKDAHTFAAGDLLKLVYTTDTITNTPKVAACIEVEC